MEQVKKVTAAAASVPHDQQKWTTTGGSISGPRQQQNVRCHICMTCVTVELEMWHELLYQELSLPRTILKSSYSVADKQ